MKSVRIANRRAGTGLTRGVRSRAQAGKNAGLRVADFAIRSRSQSAFTLAEVLAALVFMAIVIPVAIEGLSIAGRAGEVAARKGEAALVAERVLNTAMVTTNWTQSVQTGSEGKGTAHAFSWTVKNEAWNEDANQNAIRLISVEVIYTAQGREYSVRLSTLADSSAPLSQQTSQSTQSTTQ